MSEDGHEYISMDAYNELAEKLRAATTRLEWIESTAATLSTVAHGNAELVRLGNEMTREADAKLAAAVAMLSKHQWAGREGDIHFCPECFVDDFSRSGKHDPDCALAAIIEGRPEPTA